MNMNVRTERALIRTIAGASRKLDEDLELSPLQAIDRLQKLHSKFQEHWTGSSPWLVLEDCYTLPVQMPVQKMLHEIDKHGQPVGIAGVAWLTSKRATVFRMNFREDEKSRRTVERSAQAAMELVNKALDEKIRSLGNLHEGTQHEGH